MQNGFTVVDEDEAKTTVQGDDVGSCPGPGTSVVKSTPEPA